MSITSGKVTMKEIAERCGVSKSLVSRILNQDPSLRTTPQTRERVLTAVEAAGYVRDHHAQALAHVRTAAVPPARRIGYVTFSSRSHIGHPYFSHIIDAVVDEATRCGVQVPFRVTVEEFRRRVEELTAEYAADPLDGLILLGAVKDDCLTAAIHRIAPRVVSVDGQFDRSSDYVGVDTARSILLGLDHLLGLGYTDIGVLCGSDDRRLTACEERMHECGLTLDPAWIIDCGYSVDIARERVAKKLRSCPPPRAIVACNDEMAIGCIKALKDAGLRIPQDVAVTGHDDISLAAYVDVPLTTVRVYKKEIGRLAVKILLDRIETGRRNAVQLEVPGKLIKRASCGWKLAGAENDRRNDP